jgi:hypothetical protein
MNESDNYNVRLKVIGFIYIENLYEVIYKNLYYTLKSFIAKITAESNS